MSRGVSIIVCTHNGARRLPETLRHLGRVRAEAGLPWEVIIVDNRSRDGTADVAWREWPGTAPLRVVREPRLGLIHARLCGVREARFDILSFIDDDNWVAPDWVSMVHAIFDEHAEVGVCGGLVHPEHESPPPDWFETFQDNFAIGPQEKESGDISESRQHVWGAGLCIRKSIITDLLEKGFVPQLSGRRGRRQLAGEDSELCYVALLAGWRIRYDTRLQLSHFIPSGRADWNNLRRMFRGFGASHVILGMYTSLLASSSRGNRPEPRLDQLARVLRILRRYPFHYLLRPRPAGVRQQLEIDFYLANLKSLLRLFFSYNRIFHRIQALFPPPALPPYRWGETLPFDSSAIPYLREGWGRIESYLLPATGKPLHYIKTIGKSACLLVRLAEIPELPNSVLDIHISWAYIFPPRIERQRLILRINGRRIRSWNIERKTYQLIQATFPTSVLQRQTPLEIELRLPNAMAPSTVQGIRDDRRQALALLSIRLHGGREMDPVRPRP